MARQTISIHALLAESDLGQVSGSVHRTMISIHALLAESDIEEVEKLSRVTIISIHALLAESDALVPHQQKSGNRFLSTLSLRRAT